jgi:hypothetical protein
MDPNEALQDAREAHEGFIDAREIEDDEAMEMWANRLATAFGVLDTWLKGGGFLPSGWPGYL